MFLQVHRHKLDTELLPPDIRKLGDQFVQSTKEEMLEWRKQAPAHRPSAATPPTATPSAATPSAATSSAARTSAIRPSIATAATSERATAPGARGGSSSRSSAARAHQPRSGPRPRRVTHRQPQANRPIKCRRCAAEDMACQDGSNEDESCLGCEHVGVVCEPRE